MVRRKKEGNPGSGFLMFMLAVFILILTLLLIARKYKQINPEPQMQRKGVALVIRPAIPRKLACHLGWPHRMADLATFRF